MSSSRTASPSSRASPVAGSTSSIEHRASSVNLYHPYFAASRKHYEGLLELLSHELFHAWNGKRIAPRALLQPDYAREVYTPCLWLMEGLTSHYDRFALRSANRITARSFLDKVLDDWARLMATPGRRRHSLEAASFDAWIKLYRPDESNLNTTVSGDYAAPSISICRRGCGYPSTRMRQTTRRTWC